MSLFLFRKINILLYEGGDKNDSIYDFAAYVGDVVDRQCTCY